MNIIVACVITVASVSVLLWSVGQLNIRASLSNTLSLPLCLKAVRWADACKSTANESLSSDGLLLFNFWSRRNVCQTCPM